MYNLLIIPDSLKLLPIPENILEIIKDYEFSKFTWNSYGLPLEGSTYSLSGKTLYYDCDISGKYNVKKIDATGHITVGAYIINSNKEDKNYLILFDLIFVKGELLEVDLIKVEEKDSKEFQKISNEAKFKISKIIRRQKSWWYRYIYIPYTYVLKTIFLPIMFILNQLYILVRWIFQKLMPI